MDGRDIGRSLLMYRGVPVLLSVAIYQQVGGSLSLSLSLMEYEWV